MPRADTINDHTGETAAMLPAFRVCSLSLGQHKLENAKFGLTKSTPRRLNQPGRCHLCPSYILQSNTLQLGHDCATLPKLLHHHKQEHWIAPGVIVKCHQLEWAAGEHSCSSVPLTETTTTSHEELKHVASFWSWFHYYDLNLYRALKCRAVRLFEIVMWACTIFKPQKAIWMQHT